MSDLSDRLLSLNHAQAEDAFALLGPHWVELSNGERVLEIRTLQPQADAITLVSDDGTPIKAMTRHAKADTVFSVQLSEAPERYRFLIQQGMQQYTLADPYAYSSPFGEVDLHLFGEGTHRQLYEKLGAQLMTHQGIDGVHFSVWAPNASRVAVIGHFNAWDGRRHPMRKHIGNGLWDIFIPQLRQGEYYKFEIKDQYGQLLPLKADPFAHQMEAAPGNASIVHKSQYQWQDSLWQSEKQQRQGTEQPMSVYEVHAGSWKRAEGNRYLSWAELADELIPYVSEMGFTHIELLPITEYPFDGSWGYQPIGLFAPTWRHGDPDAFRAFIDRCHQANIGVIVDWVPAHFPRDEFGLGRFDGTALYEHADPRQGAHQDWGTLVFNYGRSEVRNYLISNALFWVQEYHIDALRVDAVASMLYLDYSREHDQWVPNQFGGNENLEAIEFLKQLNIAVHAAGAITIAEESTAWPQVSRPTYEGGLGFSYKWNMGWMNDTLCYMKEDPVHRRYHQDKFTFSFLYAFDEHFVLPLSHDEVVHGKGSLLSRMPGDAWQQFANLRAYFGYMFAHPGRKLLFMGSEFAQGAEWNYQQSLDWHLLDIHWHRGVKTLVKDLNQVYTTSPALYQQDSSAAGFRWVDCSDSAASVLAFIRQGKREDDALLVISHMTPVVREHYRIGVPHAGHYKEIINTDADCYGGSGVGNLGKVEAEPEPAHGYPYSVVLTLPPLATLLLTFQS